MVEIDTKAGNIDEVENKNKFIGYPEIENSYQQGFIDKIKELGYGNIQYMVTEKVHGSNSQVVYDVRTGKFSYGKRSGFLADGENFYNLQDAVKGIDDRIARLAKWLVKDLGEFGQRLETVILFGEICGGSYPHEDVVKDKNACKVQKGVFYSPKNVWLAFDIAYTLAGIERPFFISANKFMTYCILADIPTVPAICAAETLDDALAVPNDRESFVYRKFGLPKIDGNIMEGVVIRPYYLDTWFGHTRLILKNKNEKFKEKSRAKKGDAPKEVPVQVKAACEEISQYVTMNRAHNVISHIGEVTAKDIGRVIMEMSKDVLADYRKDYDTLSKLEKQDEKMVTKYLSGEVAKVVRDIIVFGKG